MVVASDQPTLFYTATPTMTIAQAAGLLLQNHIGGLPVVDEQQQVVGVITETDLLRAFVEKLGP